MSTDTITYLQAKLKESTNNYSYAATEVLFQQDRLKEVQTNLDNAIAKMNEYESQTILLHRLIQEQKTILEEEKKKKTAPAPTTPLEHVKADKTEVEPIT